MWSVASRLVGPFASRVLASTPYIGRYLTVYWRCSANWWWCMFRVVVCSSGRSWGLGRGYVTTRLPAPNHRTEPQTEATALQSVSTPSRMSMWLFLSTANSCCKYVWLRMTIFHYDIWVHKLGNPHWNTIWLFHTDRFRFPFQLLCQSILYVWDHWIGSECVLCLFSTDLVPIPLTLPSKQNNISISMNSFIKIYGAKVTGHED